MRVQAIHPDWIEKMMAVLVRNSAGDNKHIALVLYDEKAQGVCYE